MNKNILYAIISILAISLAVSLMFNFNVISKKDIIEDVMLADNMAVAEEEKIEVVFELSDLSISLYGLDPSNGMALVAMCFSAENISKKPQNLFSNDLCLFDCNNCEYAVSEKHFADINQLFTVVNINPNTKKNIAVIFEVPQDMLYCIGYTENMRLNSIQSFKDNCRDIQCSYNSFKEMVSISEDMVNNLAKYKIPKTNYEVLEVETLKIN